VSARKTTRKRGACAPASTAICFQAAYAKWLAANAEVAKWDAPTGDASAAEKAQSAALDARKGAEWLLLRLPATNIVDIRTRASLVGLLFEHADLSGRPTDNIHRLMLAALIQEISRYMPA
jgi:hypothetical protein